MDGDFDEVSPSNYRLRASGSSRALDRLQFHARSCLHGHRCRIGNCHYRYAPLAQSAESAALEVCWGDTCHDAQPELHKHSDGANASDLTGFAGIEDLPQGDVAVRVALFDAEKVEIFSDETTVAPAATYPMGPDCPAEGAQGSVSVQNAKLVADRP